MNLTILPEHRKLVPFFIAFFILCNNFLWMQIIPFNAGNDEIDHFLACDFIREHKRLPVFGKDLNCYWMSNLVHMPLSKQDIDFISHLPDEQVPRYMFSIRMPYLIFPYVSYIFSAMAMLVVGLFTSDSLHVLFGARFVSAFCGAMTALLTFYIAKTLFPGKKYLAALSLVFVGFLPQFTFVSSYVNQDAFTAFSCTLLIFVWLKCLADWNIKNAVWLGCAAGALVLSKTNGYIFLILTFLLMMLTLRKSRRESLSIITVVILCMLFVCGWFFVHSYYYHGTLLPFFVRNKYVAQLVADTPAFIAQHSWDVKLNIQDAAQLKYFFWSIFESFWGVFDWRLFWMPKGFYWLASALTLAGGWGFFRSFFRIYKAVGMPQKIVFACMLFSVPVVLSLLIIYGILFDSQPQGRYLFPAIAPIAMVFCLGWLSLSGKEDHQRKIFIASCTTLIGMNIMCLVCLAAFYQLGYAYIR